MMMSDRSRVARTLGALGLVGGGLGMVLLPQVQLSAPPLIGWALVLTTALGGGLLVLLPGRVVDLLPSSVVVAAALAAHTGFVLASGGASSPFAPGYTAIVLFTAMVASLRLAVATFAVATGSLLALGIEDAAASSTALVRAVGDALTLLAVAAILSYLAWRRRRALLRASRRGIRAQARVQVLTGELAARSRLIAAFGRLSAELPLEDAAAHIAERLAQHADCQAVEILRLSDQDQLLPLAVFRAISGVRRGGGAIARQRAAHLLEQMRDSPWLERSAERRGTTQALGDCNVAAAAAIYNGEAPIGLVLTGLASGSATSSVRRASLLGVTVDAASMLSASIGSAMADREHISSTRKRLLQTLTQRAFRPVFQPIVEMSTGAVVAYEALTRFDDGTPPDARFAEAAANGLGLDYELATIEAALSAAEPLLEATRLSVNVSPDLVNDARLRALVASSSRLIILELTEHAPIDDYASLRRALAALGPIETAVDDAGAGYASLRHILELQPTYAKLDISIVRGIETDPLRQALVAGLVFFANHSGCRLIAEGIETQAEADQLSGLGVSLGQGFHFARPGPL